MNPLLIKGLCGLLGVGTVAVACVYGTGLLERKKETRESEDDSGEKTSEDVPRREEEVVDTVEQSQCAHSLDSIAKDIKSIFLNNYLDGGWTLRENQKELSDADKGSLGDKKVRFESWNSNTAEKCRNYSNIKEKIEKILGFLGDPGVSRVREEYWTPMKEMLKEVGNSNWNSY